MRSVAIEEEPEDKPKENEPHPPTKEKTSTRHHSPQPQQTSTVNHEGENIPHAMRSSFILGVSKPILGTQV